MAAVKGSRQEQAQCGAGAILRAVASNLLTRGTSPQFKLVARRTIMRTSFTLRVPGKLLAASVCFAAVASIAPRARAADDVTHRAKAEEMLKLTKTDSLMEQQLGALRDRVNMLASQESNGPDKTAAQKSLTDDYLKQVQSTTDDEVGWTKLRPMIIQFYADSFTDAELDGIIAFYKTPAGQAIVTKTPDLSGKTMTLVQDRIKDMQPKLAKMTEDYTTKMKAAAPAGGAAAPSLKPRPAAPAAAPVH
jgi:hypothetical protein